MSERTSAGVWQCVHCTTLPGVPQDPCPFCSRPQQPERSSALEPKTIPPKSPNGSVDLTSTLAQGTTTPLETSNSTSDDGINSKDGQKKTDEERSSAEKSQIQGNDHDHMYPSTGAHGLHALQVKPSADRDKISYDKSSILAHGTTMASETPKPASNLSDVPDHPTAGENGVNSEGDRKKTDSTAYSSVPNQVSSCCWVNVLEMCNL